MTPRQLADALGWEVLVDPDTAAAVTGVYAGDLLSDVLAHADEGDMLITVQAHRNAVAVAVTADLPAVLFVNSRPVDEGTLEAARDEGIALLRTDADTYASCLAVHPLLSGNG